MNQKQLIPTSDCKLENQQASNNNRQTQHQQRRHEEQKNNWQTQTFYQSRTQYIDPQVFRQTKKMFINDTTIYRIIFFMPNKQINKQKNVLTALKLRKQQVIIQNDEDKYQEKTIKNISIKSCVFTTKEIYCKFSQQFNQNHYITHIVIRANQNYLKLPKYQSDKRLIILQKQNNIYENWKPANNFIFKESNLQTTLSKLMTERYEQSSAFQDFIDYLIGLKAGDNLINEVKSHYSLNSQEYIFKLYTKIYYFYSINNFLRREAQYNILKQIRFPIRQLHTMINKLSIEQQISSVISEKIICYRGCLLNQNQIKYLFQGTGKIIKNSYFMSCSKNMKVAKTFAKNCLFEIEINMQQSKKEYSFGFCFLNQKLSHFAQEQEILFNIMNEFVVVKFEQANQKNEKLFKIKLKHKQYKDLK